MKIDSSELKDITKQINISDDKYYLGNTVLSDKHTKVYLVSEFALQGCDYVVVLVKYANALDSKYHSTFSVWEKKLAMI